MSSITSAANVLSIHTKTVGSVLMIRVHYRYSSALGISGCSTPWRPAIVDDHPIDLYKQAQHCIPLVSETIDLGDSWITATPILIDFEGKKGGTVKIRLKTDVCSIASPWLDYFKSDYKEDFDMLKEFAVEFIEEDDQAPAIAGVDEATYAD